MTSESARDIVRGLHPFSHCRSRARTISLVVTRCVSARRPSLHESGTGGLGSGWRTSATRPSQRSRHGGQQQQSNGMWVVPEPAKASVRRWPPVCVMARGDASVSRRVCAQCARTGRTVTGSPVTPSAPTRIGGNQRTTRSPSRAPRQKECQWAARTWARGEDR